MDSLAHQETNLIKIKSREPHLSYYDSLINNEHSFSKKILHLTIYISLIRNYQNQ